MTRFKGDDNYKAGGVVGGYSSADADNASAPTLIPFRIDPVTKRLLVDATVNGTGVLDGEDVDPGDFGLLIVGTDGTHYQVIKTDTSGNVMIAGLIPDSYDYVSLSYTGSNLTGVVYKVGGSGGTTVATLTLGYDGSNNLTSVTKS
jgi:hypothetical protein